MIHALLLAAQQTENATSLFSWQGTPFIIGFSLLVLLIASRTIEQPHVGPKAPLGPLGPIFNNISLAGFIASMSFGHILGVLATLTLSGLIQN
ncbi:photosystem I reaction center subunit X [Oscillatoria sp. FACHB-1407]|uniref:photosystem I reaction center subunit X n=1 Tax=Oscillatoria sp. FACHB-1407 TaxID=2692847 RepID=UPI0016863395|nr:photosystem I reaction center subunit X [Oscillatoria sp. FACHB-1407]MBD2464585.1 photosystem I reaction center subunit X [Oscillatoria sp. FACHB-1407]